MSAVGKFILELRKAGLEASQIWGDDGGAGRPMIDALAQAGWRIKRFNFGAKANDELAYVSRGAEAWTSFGRQVTTSEIVLIRDEVLISQLTTRKSVFDSRGRIGIEKKDDLRSRGLHSPDRADAVVGVFSIRNTYAGNYTKQQGFVESRDLPHGKPGPKPGRTNRATLMSPNSTLAPLPRLYSDRLAKKRFYQSRPE